MLAVWLTQLKLSGSLQSVQSPVECMPQVALVAPGCDAH